MGQNKFSVLLVDDSVDDRHFMQRIISQSTCLNVIAELADGEEAICYLKGEPPFDDRTRYPRPGVIFLDLKMPRKDGFAVLEWIKQSGPHDFLVFVISGSWLTEDITRSQALGAHGYFKKTSLKGEQQQMLREIEHACQKQNSPG